MTEQEIYQFPRQPMTTLYQASGIPLKDEIFTSDVDLYYKYGKFPFLLFFHVALVCLTTFFILGNKEEQVVFMQHNRALQSAFFFHIDTSKPNREYQKDLYITSIEELKVHMDKVIFQIFNINATLALPISYYNSDEIFLTFKHDAYFKNSSNYAYNIKNATDNPLRTFTNNQEIRDMLRTVASMEIDLQYDITMIAKGRALCQRVTMNLIYDFDYRAIIHFFVDFSFAGCPCNDITIIDGFSHGESIFAALIVVFAASEGFVILSKLYFNYKTLNMIKRHLSRKQDFDDEEMQAQAVVFLGGNQWDMIRPHEKMKFFRKWFLVFLLGNIFQILTGIFYIFYPRMTYTLLLFSGVCCLLSWVACGYFLQSEQQYGYFYVTISKSMKEYSKLATILLIFFLGYSFFDMTMFHFSERYYTVFYKTFMIVWCSMLGDVLFPLWTSTITREPLKTFFVVFGVFLILWAFGVRLMIVITEEAFQKTKMKKNFNWLNEKISVYDYLKLQLMNVQNESEGKTQEDDKNFLINDTLMKLVVNSNDIQQLLSLDLDQLEKNGYNVEHIQQTVKKLANKYRKQVTSNEVIKEIFDYDFKTDPHGIKMGIGKTDTMLLKDYYEIIERIFLNMNAMVNKQCMVLRRVKKNVEMGDETNHWEEYEEMVNKFVLLCDMVMKRLEKIRGMLNEERYAKRGESEVRE